jgi:hypothetical protein
MIDLGFGISDCGFKRRGARQKKKHRSYKDSGFGISDFRFKRRGARQKIRNTKPMTR